MAAGPSMGVETVSKGRAIYEKRLRSLLEPSRDGEFVAIDVQSGDYEVAATSVAAADRLRKRHPGGTPYFHRIGHSCTFKLGGRTNVARQP